MSSQSLIKSHRIITRFFQSMDMFFPGWKIYSEKNYGKKNVMFPRYFHNDKMRKTLDEMMKLVDEIEKIAEKLDEIKAFYGIIATHVNYLDHEHLSQKKYEDYDFDEYCLLKP